MTITVFTKPGCMPCTATLRALAKYGLSHATVDLATDPEALVAVQELGYQQAPVVVAGDDHWSGFRPDKIKAIADGQATGQVA